MYIPVRELRADVVCGNPGVTAPVTGCTNGASWELGRKAVLFQDLAREFVSLKTS
jgi:hypothetical protein